MHNLLLRIERAATVVSVVAIVVMMLVTSYDAFARYALGAPLPWSFQITSYYLLATAIYFSLSATFEKGDHISIDAFRNVMPPGLVRLSDSVWSLLSAGVFGVIAYGAATSMIHAYKSSEFLPGHIRWPVWLAILPIVFGSGLLTLRLLVYAGGLISGRTAPKLTHGDEAV